MSSFNMIDLLFLAAQGPRGLRDFGPGRRHRTNHPRQPSLSAPLPLRAAWLR